MAINFPASPTNNQTFTSGGITWIYSTTIGAWKIVANTITGTQGVQGLQGIQGISNQGVQGTQGPQGIQGFQGTSIQGSSGTTQGIQGANGFQGIQGTSVQGTTGTQGFAIATSINATAVTTDTKLYPVLVYAPGSSQTAQTIPAFSFNASGNIFTIGTHTSQSGTITYNGAANSIKGIVLSSSNLWRWFIQTDNTPEAGSNTGQNLNFSRYNDAGTFVDVPLSIGRANGITSITNLNVSGNFTANVPWSIVTGKPTTVSGYGITDALTATNTTAVDIQFDSIGVGTAATGTTGQIQATNYAISADTNNRFVQGAFYLRNTSPTIYFRDTDHNSAMIHCNSNLLYVLRGNTDSETWFALNGQWPFQFNLATNEAVCGNNFFSVGNVTAYYSDKRLKKDIVPITDALEKVNQITGITYKNNELAKSFGFNDDTEQVGVISQEIQKVLPQVVVPAPFDMETDAVSGTSKSKSGEDYKTVMYDKIVPLLIEAIKEMSTKIDNLEEQIEVLKNK